MSAEPAGTTPGSSPPRTGRIECSFDNDARLMVSLGTIISHAAKRAGQPEKTQEDVARATLEASGEMLASANGKAGAASKTKILVEEFSDRLEVTVESPACARAEGIRKRLEGTPTDRIQCDGREGLVRVTLLKSCSAAKSGSPI
jgi:hypothetical protein